MASTRSLTTKKREQTAKKSTRQATTPQPDTNTAPSVVLPLYKVTLRVGNEVLKEAEDVDLATAIRSMSMPLFQKAVITVTYGELKAERPLFPFQSRRIFGKELNSILFAKVFKTLFK